MSTEEVKLGSVNTKTKYVLVTGKFQNPLHIAHLQLLFAGMDRAKELGVPLIVVTGPGDDILKREFGDRGLTMRQRRKFLSIITDIEKDMIFGHESYSHGGKQQFKKYEKELKKIFEKLDCSPEEVEMCVVIKDSDRKHYIGETDIKGNPLKKLHYAELLNKRIRIKIYQPENFPDLVGLSSTAIRNDDSMAKKFMSAASFMLKTFKEGNIDLDAGIWAFLKNIHNISEHLPADKVTDELKEVINLLDDVIYHNYIMLSKEGTRRFIESPGKKEGGDPEQTSGMITMMSLMKVANRPARQQTLITYNDYIDKDGNRVSYPSEMMRGHSNEIIFER